MEDLYSFGEFQQVYIACRSIFKGRNAKIRRLNRTKKALRSNKPLVEFVVQEMGEDKVNNIALCLLKDRMFTDEVKAYARFPGAFQMGEGMKSGITHSDTDMTASHAVDPDGNVFSSDDDMHIVRTPDWDSGSDMASAEYQKEVGSCKSTFRNTSFMCTSDSQVLTTIAAKPGQLPKAGLPTTTQSSTMPIPYNTQRRLLMTVQSVLNESCFNFMSTWIPKMLHDVEARQCDSAGGPTSPNVAPGGPCYQLPTEAMNFVSSPDAIIEAFKSARSLQQACSQMSQITFGDIGEMLKPAMMVVEGLRNPLGACKIRELRKEIDSQVEIIQATKRVLEDRVATQMKDIHRQREELEKREQALIDEMAKEESNQSALLSGAIGLFLDKTFGSEPLNTQTARGLAAERFTNEAAKEPAEESAGRSDDGFYGLFD